MTLRPLRAYREINRDLTRLRLDDLAAQEEARLELTRRATLFSRRSREVVDNTMQLSAILLRAGEVEEANRLLVEADQRVEQERAALMESVTETKVKGEVRRRKMTRLRLAKMLVSAILGAGLMVFSAFGVALANYLVPEADAAPTQGASNAFFAQNNRTGRDDLRMREVRIAPGVTVSLTMSQFVELKQLKERGADGSEIAAFLADLLPGHLIDRVVALTGTIAELPQVTIDARQLAAKKQASEPAQPEASSAESTDDQADKPKAEDDGDDQTDPGDPGSTEDCEDKEGDGETGFYESGDCIPLVNKESPL